LAGSRLKFIKSHVNSRFKNTQHIFRHFLEFSWDLTVISEISGEFQSFSIIVTLNLIKAAQAIASQMHGYSIDKNNLDPVTLAALSALGQFSHATNGVLVNVIDPRPHRGGITYNQTSSPSLLSNVHSTPPAGGTAGGFFKNLRGDTANTQPPSWESSNHSNLHLFSKLHTTFNRDYS